MLRTILQASGNPTNHLYMFRVDEGKDGEIGPCGGWELELEGADHQCDHSMSFKSFKIYHVLLLKPR